MKDGNYHIQVWKPVKPDITDWRTVTMARRLATAKRWAKILTQSPDDPPGTRARVLLVCATFENGEEV